MNTSTKMKILYVFCVVLYFQCGVSAYPPINNINQNQKSALYNDHRNMGVNPNIPFNFRNNQSEIRYQNQQHKKVMDQHFMPVRTISEPNHGKVTGSTVREHSSQYINTELLEINKETSKRDNNVPNTQVVPSNYLHIQPIRKFDEEKLRPQTDTKQFVPHILRDLNGKANQPSYKSDGDITLEMQAATPEYIQSLLGEQKPRILNQNPINYVNKNTIGEFKHTNSPQISYQSNYNENLRASYQNPSAEQVYKLNQALPYKINNQQLMNNPQDHAYVKNIINNSRRIQDIYKSEKPGKRYTIIHPDGKIEYVNQIDSIIQQNPNYILVRSQDVIKKFQGIPNEFRNPETPIKQNPSIKPIMANSQQSSVIKQEENRDNNININSKNSATISETKTTLINKTKLPQTTEINFKGTIINKTRDTTENGPIHLPQSEVSPTVASRIISKPKPTSVSTIKKISDQHPKNSIAKSVQENQQKQNNLDKKKSRNENGNVIVSNVLLNSSTTAIRPVNDGKNFTDILINTTPTPILNESITSAQDVKRNCSDPIHLKSKEQKNDLITSLPSTPLPSNENVKDDPPFLFKADEQFWDKLMGGNNTQNMIYFLFVPPKPNPEKETKTTIYPNGTTIVEVIERINSDDGEPKVKKSTTVTLKNNTEVF